MKKYFIRLRTWHSYLALGILLIIAAIGLRYYLLRNSPNVQVEGAATYLYIPTGATMEQVLDSLRKLKALKVESRFIKAAESKKYASSIRPGRYKLTDGMTNTALLNKLIRGLQDPVRLTLSGNIRSNERLAFLMSRYVEADSAIIAFTLNDPTVASEYGFTPATIMGMFIPNTYEVYWNTAPEALLKRMKREYDNFWTGKRKNKAETLGLSLQEVTVLAAIVYEEILKNDEMPRIAGVYMNRLKKKMTLDADPTLKFAAGDFTLRRILNRHKLIDSPYNTYKYTGLPPGPICVPSAAAIDAVLNYEQHDYLYFCAKPDLSGYHDFAKTLAQHNQNARNYHQMLNRNRIYR
ncbi:MAG: endolytic transglycosylase MltG [Bacteroidales bacterium]|nr:endolytic transglycosylase MltG [Bacteroidales bacterium]MCL2133338.1 endolytic transglycosylase MltG [Bacteroidales bacterium]